MRSIHRAARRVAILVVAVTSVAFSLALVWRAVTPETIGRIPTVYLVGLLALVVLPGATLAAILFDRKVRRSQPVQPVDRRRHLETAGRTDRPDPHRKRVRSVHVAHQPESL